MDRRSKSDASSGRASGYIPLEYVEAYTFQAVDYCRDGEMGHALAALGKALSLDPQSQPALLMRAGLWMGLGRPRKAITDLSKALVIDSCHIAGYFVRGQAHQSLGHFRAAIADYSRVLRLDADHRDALVNRAVLHWYFKRYDLAIADFNRLGVPAPLIVKALSKWTGTNITK